MSRCLRNEVDKKTLTREDDKFDANQIISQYKIDIQKDPEVGSGGMEDYTPPADRSHPPQVKRQNINSNEIMEELIPVTDCRSVFLMANSADNITLSANGNVLCSPVSDEDTSRPMMIYLLSSSISNLEGRSSDESVRGNTFSYPSAAGVNNISDVNKSVRIQKHPVVPAQSANEIRLLEVKSLFISNSLDHLLLAIIIHIVKEDLPKFIQCCSSYPTILNRSNPYKVYAELVRYLVNGPKGLPNFMFVTEQEKYSSDRKGYKQKVGAQEPLDQIPVIVSCSRCKTEKETFYILDLRRETRDPLVTVQQALDSWLQSLRCKRCGNLVEGAILTAHVPVILPVPVKQLEINVVEEMNKFLKISGKWLMFCGAVFYSPEQQHFTAMAKYGDESIYFDIKANPGSGQITRIVKEPESATMRMAYYFLL